MIFRVLGQPPRGHRSQGHPWWSPSPGLAIEVRTKDGTHKGCPYVFHGFSCGRVGMERLDGIPRQKGQKETERDSLENRLRKQSSEPMANGWKSGGLSTH